MRKNLRARSGQIVLLAIFVIAIAAGFILWKVPEWQTPSDISGTAGISAQIENEFRKTLAQIILGVLLLGTLYVAWKRASAAERTVEVAQESQITERFTRAIEQLGSDKMAIRLGGIYALERIANDSAKDRWQIVQVLTAYIRDKPSWEHGTETEESHQATTTDIQAILTVLGQLNTDYGETGRRIDLHNADLRETDLRYINFHGAILRGAKLQGVPLDGINLESADLRYCDFRKTCLTGANLQKANLIAADFRGADLANANFQESNLSRADFQWGPLKYVVDRYEGATPDAPREKTILINANFRQAVLTTASFMGADLTKANFEGADLSASYFGRMSFSGAGEGSVGPLGWATNLKSANLRGAYIMAADFRTAVGLTQEQVDSAISDGTTLLPEHLVSRVEG